MSLPTCPKCRKTDYRLEYAIPAVKGGQAPRSGYRICNRCSHRWRAEWSEAEVVMSLPTVTGATVARPLVEVRLTAFEWSVILAVLDIARDGMEEAGWLHALRPEMEALASDIETQAGLAKEEPAPEGEQP